MRTIFVSGALANKPHNGGEAWVRLSWIRGFQRIGYDVQFVEQIEPSVCVDRSGAPAAFRDSVNLAYFRDVTRQSGLAECSTLICGAGEDREGLDHKELLSAAARADLLVNISGHLRLPDLLGNFTRKAYIDIDPGFTQFWHAAGDLRIADHDFYFTIAENIGRADCEIPMGEIPWQTIRQPVVLEDWASRVEPPPAPPFRFTTIASWRGAFGRVTHAGKTYGLKAHEFRKFVSLPRKAPGVFELALDIHPGDERDTVLLREHGWRVVDPRGVAHGPAEFREYVLASHAEFSVAQGIHVETSSGWFSDRTVRYLAAGRPAVVQDTGFSRVIPTGEGLLAFGTVEEAASGVERIVGDYQRHCEAARAIAREHFDSDKVLRRFLQAVNVAD